MAGFCAPFPLLLTYHNEAAPQRAAHVAPSVWKSFHPTCILKWCHSFSSNRAPTPPFSHFQTEQRDAHTRDSREGLCLAGSNPFPGLGMRNYPSVQWFWSHWFLQVRCCRDPAFWRIRRGGCWRSPASWSGRAQPSAGCGPTGTWHSPSCSTPWWPWNRKNGCCSASTWSCWSRWWCSTPFLLRNANVLDNGWFSLHLTPPICHRKVRWYRHAVGMPTSKAALGRDFPPRGKISTVGHRQPKGGVLHRCAITFWVGIGNRTEGCFFCFPVRHVSPGRCSTAFSGARPGPVV